MSMIDGVNKVFVVQSRSGAMEFHGHKSERELVESMLYGAGLRENGYDTANQVAWLNCLKAMIDEAIEQHQREETSA